MGATGKGKGGDPTHEPRGGEDVEVGSEIEHGEHESEHENFNNNKKNLPNIKLPEFHGGANQDPGNFKEWVREITAMQMAYQIPDRNYAGLVFLATKSDARDVLWELSPSDLKLEGTLTKIMNLLTKEYDRPDWEKSEHAHHVFEQVRRRPRQRMVAYLREHQKAYLKMVKEDGGTKLSDQHMAVRILRRSGLTHEEQRQVLAACNNIHDLEKIKVALSINWGAAHKDDHRRPFFNSGGAPQQRKGKAKGKGKNHRRPFGTHVTQHADYENEEYYYEEDEYNYLNEDNDQNIPEDEHHEDEEECDGEEEAPAEEDDGEEDEEDLNEEEVNEIYETLVTVMRAGKKLRSKTKGWRKGKGKGKSASSSTALQPAHAHVATNSNFKKTGKCMDCGKYGHWKGDPECDFVKRGIRKPFQAVKSNFVGMVRWKRAEDADGNFFWFEALPEDEEDPTDVMAEEIEDHNPREQTGVVKLKTLDIPNVNSVSATGATSSWVATEVATANPATTTTSAALSVSTPNRWNRRAKRPLESPLPETFPQYFDIADPGEENFEDVFEDAMSDEEGPISEETFDSKENDDLSVMAKAGMKLRIRGEHDPSLSDSDVERPPGPPNENPPQVRMVSPPAPPRWRHVWDPWAEVYVRHPVDPKEEFSNAPHYIVQDDNGQSHYTTTPTPKSTTATAPPPTPKPVIPTPLTAWKSQATPTWEQVPEAIRLARVKAVREPPVKAPPMGMNPTLPMKAPPAHLQVPVLPTVQAPVGQNVLPELAPPPPKASEEQLSGMNDDRMPGTQSKSAMFIKFYDREDGTRWAIQPDGEELPVKPMPIRKKKAKTHAAEVNTVKSEVKQVKEEENQPLPEPDLPEPDLHDHDSADPDLPDHEDNQDHPEGYDEPRGVVINARDITLTTNPIVPHNYYLEKMNLKNMREKRDRIGAKTVVFG